MTPKYKRTAQWKKNIVIFSPNQKWEIWKESTADWVNQIWSPNQNLQKEKNQLLIGWARLRFGWAESTLGPCCQTWGLLMVMQFLQNIFETKTQTKMFVDYFFKILLNKLSFHFPMESLFQNVMSNIWQHFPLFF